MEEKNNTDISMLTKTGKTDKKPRKEKKPKKNPVKQFFENLFSEFRKIIWSSREDLIKQTLVVIVISLVMGVLIFGMDALFNFLQSLAAGLAS